MPSTVEGRPCSLLSQLPILVMVFLIWLCEFRLRCLRADGTQAWAWPGAGRLLRQHAAEATGVAAFIAVAVCLRMRSFGKGDAADQEAWEALMSEWPILTTADSLLALQAMFRLVVLLSACMRKDEYAGRFHGSVLAGEPAFFFLLAAVCRTAITAFSPEHGLEGPFEGIIHKVTEAAAVPLLLWLSFSGMLGGLVRRSFGMVSAILAIGYVASRHRLGFAGDHRDSAFTAVHLFELVAVAACFARTVAASGTQNSFRARGFVPAALPLQQAMSFYFFMTAFDDGLTNISIGQPLALVQISGALQVGMLLFTAALNLASGAGRPEEGETMVSYDQSCHEEPQLSQIVF